MANVCEKCGKRPQVKNLISHSNRKTKTRDLPNTAVKKIIDRITGKVTKMRICMKCLKSSVNPMSLRKMRKNARTAKTAVAA